MAYSYNRAKFAETNELARLCWTDFLDRVLNELSDFYPELGLNEEWSIAEDLLSPVTNHTISFTAVLFAQFCLVDHPRYGGPSLSGIDCDWDNADQFPGPSWLFVQSRHAVQVRYAATA